MVDCITAFEVEPTCVEPEELSPSCLSGVSLASTCVVASGVGGLSCVEPVEVTPECLGVVFSFAFFSEDGLTELEEGDFGAVAWPDSGSLVVRLVNTGNRPLNVSPSASGGFAFTALVDSEIAVGGYALLTLSFPVDYTNSGSYNGNLTIVSEAGTDVLPLTIAVTGFFDQIETFITPSRTSTYTASVSSASTFLTPVAGTTYIISILGAVDFYSPSYGDVETSDIETAETFLN